MLFDPNSLSALPPHGDPSPEARFREEFLTTPRKKAAAKVADPQLVRRSNDLREQVIARVGRFFA